jgi:hypothetical protein
MTTITTPAQDAVAHSEPSCAPCAYRSVHAEYGSTLGNGKSHCTACHRTWASPTEGHCARCHVHFAGYPDFDAHLGPDDEVEGIHHYKPSEVIREDGRPRFTSRGTPFGTTYRIAFYGKMPDFAAQKKASELPLSEL